MKRNVLPSPFPELLLLISLILFCTGSPMAAPLLFEARLDYECDPDTIEPDRQSSPVAGDLDEDGYPDLVVVNIESESVSVFMNRGNGTFSDPTHIMIDPYSPEDLALVDLDGDEALDMIVVHVFGTGLVFMGNGDGTFQEPYALTSPFHAYSVEVGDLNGDGAWDLVTHYHENPSLYVVTGNGDGSFQDPQGYTFDFTVQKATVGDLNDDGLDDLVLTCYETDGVFIALNNGDGTFQEPVLYPTGDDANGVSIGDLNGDDMPDLVVLDRVGDQVAIRLGNGDGTFQDAVFIPVGNGPSTSSIKDINGDDVPDVVIGMSYEHHLTVLFGIGDGTFLPPETVVLGVDGSFPSIVDLDQDGIQDVVVDIPDDSISVLFGRGGGSFHVAPNYEAGYCSNGAVQGDLNGDGLHDLAVPQRCSGIGVKVLLGNGDGTLQEATSHWTPGVHTSLSLGDMNGDTFLDLVYTTEYDELGGSFDRLYVILGNGDGTFQNSSAWQGYVGRISRSTTVGDLNGDELLDVVVANDETDDVAVLLGNGDGTLQDAVSYGLDAGAYSVAIEDLNHDDVPDLAVANRIYVSVLLGNGDGTFQAHVGYPTEYFTRTLAVGDLNEDTHMDLAVADGAWSGRLLVFLGNGDGAFQVPIEYPLMHYPAALVLVDLDVDGHLDAAVAHDEYTYSVSVLLGNGDGTLTADLNYGAGHRPSSLITGDFNGDGFPDLVTANEYNGDEDITLLINIASNHCEDLDMDGYGDPASPVCPYHGLDCDDSDPDVNPGAAEVCDNSTDDDCDALIDSDDPDCCNDTDGDGYGDPASAYCTYPELDCNDTNPDVNPGVEENTAAGNCNDGINNDCEQGIDCADPDCSDDPACQPVHQAAVIPQGSFPGTDREESSVLNYISFYVLVPFAALFVVRGFMRRRK